jgi:acetyl-CoA carboxylase biotin carboxyl carrier protein
MALNMQEVRELIRLIDESHIEEFELENEGTKVVIRKGVGGRTVGTATPTAAGVSVPAPVPVVAAPFAAAVGHALQERVPMDETLHKIVSPMVGTFYRAPSPDTAPYVSEGDEVQPQTIVCIIEAMKLMNEMEAEVTGRIVEILVENGQLVEYAQSLFLVKTD